MLEQPPPAHFVLLTRVGDIVAARVVAAKIQSEGIEVRVHSPAFGPYPVTVGAMAETEIWVLDDRLEEASRIVLDAEINTTLAGADPEVPPRAEMPFEMKVAAAVIAVVLGVLFILRFASVY